MDFEKDYYRVLGLKDDAGSAAIKEAYRSLAKKYHPDLHPGDEDCARHMQSVNEAWEVLGNESNRFVYDEFRKHTRKLAEEEAAERSRQERAAQTRTVRSRTFKKKTYVPVEERFYLKGKLFIKYHGIQDEESTVDVLKEVDYRLTRTDVRALVSAEDIYRGGMPESFRAVFEGSKVSLPPLDAIRLVVVSGEQERHYRLVIQDLTVLELRVVKVTKDDGDSFGTLEGIFYGYLLFTSYNEEETEVTEAYGPTGRTERKTENGTRFERSEYYHKDGSTYWGQWGQTKGQGPRGNVYRPGAVRRAASASSGGCLGSLGTLVVYGIWGIMLLMILPKLLFILPFIFFWWVLSLIAGGRWRVIGHVIGLLAGLAFLAIVFTRVVRPPAPPRQVKKQVSEKQIRRTPVPKEQDTLITRYREWMDYDGQRYSGWYRIRQRAVRKAGAEKMQLSSVMQVSADADYDRILAYFSAADSSRVQGVYRMLDGIRKTRNPDVQRFAEILVSMVQDIPYAVVLPSACDARLYEDRFIQDYLSRPDARCNADQPFGINTPVEFLAGLQGDCDTRTLLIYTMLKHYGYKVAILSSSFYNHSLIGVELPLEGTAFESPYGRFILWETTATARPGLIPSEVADLSYWRISLVSKP